MNNENSNINASIDPRLALYVRDHAVDILTVNDDSVKFSSIEVDRTINGPAKVIEEAVYSSPALLGGYNRIDVIVGFESFVTAPAECQPDKVAAALWPSDRLSDSVVISDRCSGDANIISLTDKHLHGFVNRTFGQASLHNRLAGLVNFFAGLSRPVNRVKMYAHITPDSRLDIVALTGDGLLMANTFVCQDENDILYFIMASVEDCGFDALDDEFILCGDRDKCSALTGPLRNYLNSVMPLLLPDCDASLPLELLIYKK